MFKIKRAVNALTIVIFWIEVTFWQRAEGSTGMIECYRLQNSVRGQLVLFGYMVGFSLPMPERVVPLGGLQLVPSTTLPGFTHYNRSDTYGVRVRRHIKRRIGDVLGHLFAWALSHYAVQRAIADTFDGSTPMCAVLRRSVEAADVEVDAGNVKDLDSYIEEAVSSAFKAHEEEMHDDLHDELVDAVVEEIINKLRA